MDSALLDHPVGVDLLQIVRSENLDVEFDGELNLLMKPSDLHYGNWKKTVAHLR